LYEDLADDDPMAKKIRTRTQGEDPNLGVRIKNETGKRSATQGGMTRRPGTKDGNSSSGAARPSTDDRPRKRPSEAGDETKPATTTRKTSTGTRSGGGTARPRPENPEAKATAPKQTEEAAAKKPAPERKPQNFLTDDDEFDFEFLNIDD
jgi:cell division protein FtsN